jgi:hypothetical protein
MKRWSERFLAAVIISALALVFYAIWFDFPKDVGEKLYYQWNFLLIAGFVWFAYDRIKGIK